MDTILDKLHAVDAANRKKLGLTTKATLFIDSDGQFVIKELRATQFYPLVNQTPEQVDYLRLWNRFYDITVELFNRKV